MLPASAVNGLRREAKIVDSLLEHRIIIELDRLEPRRGAGRRGHLLQFNPRAFYAIGISFEGQFASVGLVDLDGTCSHCRTMCIPQSDDRVALEALLPEIRELCAVWAVIVITGGSIGFLNDQALAGSITYSLFGRFNPFY